MEDEGYMKVLMVPQRVLDSGDHYKVKLPGDGHKCCGSKGFLCAELLGGYSDVLDYVLMWRNDNAIFPYDPEAFESYITQFEKEGRPRDGGVAEMMHNIDELDPLKESELHKKAMLPVTDEFMKQLRDFAKLGRALAKLHPMVVIY